MAITERGGGARFLRRTVLGPDEYRTNFRQIDCDVIEEITSNEACRVTPQMSRIYLRLIQAPGRLWEREGVLRFSGEEREGAWLTAWDQLLSVVGVASATARKSISWMNEKGIIGYFAGKNGVGIRIFINRASSSIRERSKPEQKNLRLVRASTAAPRASTVETPFKESFAKKENLETDLVPPAPERGGEQIETQIGVEQGKKTDAETGRARVQNETAIVERIVERIGPQLKVASEREHERTRQWFVEHALPKAIRVAQRSAYDILRANDAISRAAEGGRRTRPDNSRIGANPSVTSRTQVPLSEREINDVAEGCAAIVFAQGRDLDRTLSELVATGGVFLSAEETVRVRVRAEALIADAQIGEGGSGAA
jgi:hypothetical protein